MRAIVATLYVLGALLTGAGVLLAYRRARRDLRLLEDVARLHESHEDPDLTALADDAIADDLNSVQAREARQETEREALAERLRSVGMGDQPIRLKDLRLPMEYWAKRSALRDAVASFRSGGLIALAGLLVSTGASVWSLYLPVSG